MNSSLLRALGWLLLLLCTTVVLVHAAEPAVPAAAASAAAGATAPEPAAAGDDNADTWDGRRHHGRHVWRAHPDSPDRGDNDVVRIGHDSHLASGDQANSVVSILGSSSSDGDAVDVVSVLGSTHVTGTVRDSAVAVVGNLYID